MQYQQLQHVPDKSSKSPLSKYECLREAYTWKKQTKSGYLQTGEGGGSQGPPDPKNVHVNKKSTFGGEGGGPGPQEFEIQILFW